MDPFALPPLDTRRAADFTRQAGELLQHYAPPAPSAGAAPALVGVFARFAEIVVERLNQAPEKKRLAFFDLLGASPLPPQPARTALTFSLAASGPASVAVPAGTAVAAPPPPGQSEPVVFETERALVVSAAVLGAAFSRDPTTDRFADRSAGLLGPQAQAVSVFDGDSATEHVLFIASSALAPAAAFDELRLRVQLAADLPAADPRSVEWDLWDGAAGLPLTVTADGSANLTKSGTIVFSRLQPPPLQTVAGHRTAWLRCRLLTPITTATTAQPGRVRSEQLPTLVAVGLQGHFDRSGLAPLALLANTQTLDADQPLLPFGQRPAFGDVFYVGLDEAFALAGAAITLHLTLANPQGGTPASVVAAKASSDLALAWETWDGRNWVLQKPDADSTERLTRSGDVTLALPAAVAARSLSGVRALWLRLRIAAGDYGKEGSFELVTPPAATPPKPQTFNAIAPSLAPPILAGVAVDFAATLPEQPAEAIVARNDFQDTLMQGTQGAPLQPFQPMAERRPALYLGFESPPGQRALPAAPLSFHADVPELLFGRPPDDAAAAAAPRLVWEYWNGSAWAALAIGDDSAGLTRAGVVEWLPPPDLSLLADFGLAAKFWIRLRWTEGDLRFLPQVEHLRLNTTMALQAATVIDEVLGSSDGSKRQRFKTRRQPVLPGELLQVRESGVAAAPGDAPGSGAWVAWSVVDDFHGSGPLDRHAVLDRASGELVFGDGVHGLIPPIGVGNLRLARYRCGGGRAGNVAAGAVAGLQTAIASIDRVANADPASGGADAEAFADFALRAPRTVRHRGKAVALDDYEDLACMASPEVMRARAVALLDLALDPDGRRESPGRVSVIVVPRSAALRPTPSLALLARVQAWLDERCSPLAVLSVVGPEYLRVDVTAEVAVSSMDEAATLTARVQAELARFLHSLTGGPDGTGWAFGRRPHRSDLFSLLEQVPGVDHVRTLQVAEKEDRLGVAGTGRFLVYSGDHRISLVAA